MAASSNLTLLGCGLLRPALLVGMALVGGGLGVAAGRMAGRRGLRVLRRQLREQHAAYEGAPAPLALLDAGMRCVAFNSAFCRTLGLDPDVLQGRCLPLLLPVAADALRPALRAAADRREACHELEIALPAADGARTDWMFSIVPAPEGGLAIGAVDVTARRRAETELRRQAVGLEARVRNRTAALETEIAQRSRAETALIQGQRIEAVGQLTGGVAHDFNNLLTAVLGSLELALARTDDPGLLRLIGVARGAAERGAKLTGQLLAFSRKQRLEIVTIDFAALVRGMEDLLHRTLGPELRIDHRLCPELWPARGDRNQLELCLLNLAINARDAMGGAGRIAIETCNMHQHDPDLPAELPNADYVTLAVVDHGAGMPPEVLARCTEPFFSTKPQDKGTGLGLSMVLGVAQQSGGTVRIHSLPGRGTTVRLFLPRAPAERHAPAAVPAPFAPPGRPAATPFPGLRVMVVDDDADVREVTVAQLETLGCAIAAHGNGREALAALSANPADVDVLLTDFAMPGMSGGELARAARRLRPDLPVLVMTGYAAHGEAAAEPAIEAAVLGKPFTQDGLAHKLRELLLAPQAGMRRGGQAAVSGISGAPSAPT